MRYSFLLVSLAAVGVTAPASAATVVLGGGLTVCDSPGCVQPDSNILFQGSAVGNPITGVLNDAPSVNVIFSSTESLTGTLSNGQARIAGTDGTLTTLTFGLASGFTFSEVEFNINSLVNGSALVTFQSGGQTFSYDIGQNGQNYLGAFGAPITSVTITASPANIIGDVRQIRLGGIAVAPIPEPATWALMIGGFGLVGGAMRRSRVRKIAYA